MLSLRPKNVKTEKDGMPILAQWKSDLEIYIYPAGMKKDNIDGIVAHEYAHSIFMRHGPNPEDFKHPEGSYPGD